MPATEATPTILVVEDNRDVLAVIAHALTNSGFAVTRAYDGEMGLTRRSTPRPHWWCSTSDCRSAPASTSLQSCGSGDFTRRC
jgi:ActR/RegA family two-component response regulator